MLTIVNSSIIFQSFGHQAQNFIYLLCIRLAAEISEAEISKTHHILYTLPILIQIQLKPTFNHAV